jgi:hypothetical protein
MKFEILKDSEKSERKRKYVTEKYSLESFGSIVRYVMPALESPFPKLSALLEHGPYPRQFWGIDYFIATNNNYIETIVPASGYYKIAFRSIADELYSINLSKTRIDRILDEINTAYRTTREVLPGTNQSSFYAYEYVYQLKSELGNFFFVSRSILDTAATLMHFLYGPKSKQHRSFSRFREFTLKNQDPKFLTDDEMKIYMTKNMTWYLRLKDTRDYITHHKSMDIDFFEQPTGDIRVYLESQFELSGFVHSVYGGISEFFTFIDGHFTRRLTEHTANSHGEESAS